MQSHVSVQLAQGGNAKPTMPTVSLLSLDVGFDLRVTRHRVELPALPFACKYSRDNQCDDAAIVTHVCESEVDLAELRSDLAAAGYVV